MYNTHTTQIVANNDIWINQKKFLVSHVHQRQVRSSPLNKDKLHPSQTWLVTSNWESHYLIGAAVRTGLTKCFVSTQV